MLNFTVKTTILLLLLAALLVTMGIFNDALQWDIFSPSLEKILYAIFASSIALAAFGVAITFVLGIQEITQTVRLMAQQPTLGLSLGKYIKYLFYIAIVFIILIISLHFINANILSQRNQVFKKIITEQVNAIQPKLKTILEEYQFSNAVPLVLKDIMEGLEKTSFIHNNYLYLLDEESLFLWEYSTYYVDNVEKPIFKKKLIVTKEQKAIKQALQGDSTLLETLNQQNDFKQYFVIKTQKQMAVLSFIGNERESFRHY